MTVGLKGTIAVHRPYSHDPIFQIDLANYFPFLKSAALGDINGDQRPELFVAGFGDKVMVFDGASFQPLMTFNNLEVDFLVVGNVDNDVDLEMIVTTDSFFQVMNLDGSVQWQFPLSLRTQLALSDVDQDGKEEIFIAHRQLIMLEADTKTTRWFLQYTEPINDLRLGDLTGNGVPELFYSHEEVIYCVSALDGSVIWSVDEPMSQVQGKALSTTRHWFQVVDRGGQGQRDLLISLRSHAAGRIIYRFNPVTRSFKQENSLAFGPFDQIKDADIDGDGREELVAIGLVISSLSLKNAVVFLFDKETLALKSISDPLTDFDTRFGISALEIGDVDGDGEMEIILGSDDDQIRSFFIYNAVSLELERRGPVYPSDVCHLVLGDADNDNQLELFVQWSGANGGSALLNGETLAEEWTLAMPRIAPAVAMVNLDDDPNLEIVLTSFANIWLYDGASKALQGTAALPISSVAFPDLNGDGHPEIVAGSGQDLVVLDGQTLAEQSRFDDLVFINSIDTVAIEDFYGDSDLEWLIGNLGQWTLFGDPSQPPIWQSQPFLADIEKATLAIRDHNSDGVLEFISGNEHGLFQFGPIPACGNGLYLDKLSQWQTPQIDVLFLLNALDCPGLSL